MKVGKPEWNVYIYMYIFKPSTYNIFYLHSSPAVPSVPFHIAANCTAHCRTWGLFTPWRRPSQRRGASRSSLHCRFCGLFLPVAGFRTYIYIYICPSSAIDRALVSSMSVYIFYLYGTPVPFMLQEATQPTAEQKKAGGQEQGLKDCCDRTSEWKFGQPQKDPGNTVYKYIYTHV